MGTLGSLLIQESLRASQRRTEDERWRQTQAQQQDQQALQNLMALQNHMIGLQQAEHNRQLSIAQELGKAATLVGQDIKPASLEGGIGQAAGLGKLQAEAAQKQAVEENTRKLMNEQIKQEGDYAAKVQFEETIAQPNRMEMLDAQMKKQRAEAGAASGRALYEYAKKRDLDVKASKEISDYGVGAKAREVIIKDQAKAQAVAQKGLNAYTSIEKAYDKEFLNVFKQLGQRAGGSIERLVGDRLLDPAIAERYQRFATNVQLTFQNQLRAWTGSAAGKEEMERVVQTLPNLQDSPKQFMAKVREIKRLAQNEYSQASRIIESNGVLPKNYVFLAGAEEAPVEAASAQSAPVPTQAGKVLPGRYSEDPIDRAVQLRKEYPDWSDDQVEAAAWGTSQ